MISDNNRMEEDSDNEGYNSQDEKIASGAKYRRYSQKYNKEIESDPLLRGWVKESSKGDGYAYYSACDVHLKLTAGKTDLKRHSGNKKHVSNSKVAKCQSSLTSLMASKSDIDVKEDELRLAGFIAEHDLPMSIADHLPKLMKKVCKDSKIAEQIKCGRTKATGILTKVTGEESHEQLLIVLKERKFPLIVDESTDKGCVKHLCMVARVFDNESVSDNFLTLIPLKDATAQTLYSSVVIFFTDNKIPYKENLIGFAADGANSMLGAHKSLSAILKADIPHLFIMKCICHSLALCASHACQKLPRSVEDLARDIYSYFNCSPKRIGELEESQVFTNIKPHKILHPCQTRWLSLHMVVSRLLEQYEALKLYFIDEVAVDKLIATETILQRLSNPFTRLYYLFLDFVLPIFNNVNKLMQSENTQIHALHDSVSCALRTLLGCYMRETKLCNTPLKLVKFRDPGNFNPLEEIYLCVKAGIELRSQQFDRQEVDNFRKRCLDLLIEATSQIYKSFSFESQHMESFRALNPKVVFAKEIPSLVNLLQIHSHIAIDMQAIDTEWRLLRNSLGTMINVTATMKPEEFWSTVDKTQFIDNTPMFPNLSVFMTTLLCLPHSSATVERVFSAVNRMKTKTRNRLSTETMIELLQTKQLFREASSCDFKVTRSLIGKHGNWKQVMKQ